MDSPASKSPTDRFKEQTIADATEWLKWLKGRNDPQAKLLRDLLKVANGNF